VKIYPQKFTNLLNRDGKPELPSKMKICLLSRTHTFTKSLIANGGYGPIILKVAQSLFRR